MKCKVCCKDISVSFIKDQACSPTCLEKLSQVERLEDLISDAREDLQSFEESVLGSLTLRVDFLKKKRERLLNEMVRRQSRSLAISEKDSMEVQEWKLVQRIEDTEFLARARQRAAYLDRVIKKLIIREKKANKRWKILAFKVRRFERSLQEVKSSA